MGWVATARFGDWLPTRRRRSRGRLHAGQLALACPATHEEEAPNHAPLSQELRAIARGQRLDPDLVFRGDPALDQQRQDRTDAFTEVNGELLDERAAAAHQRVDLE